jgi:nucleotide-sensitive chloride channel 1A
MSSKRSRTLADADHLSNLRSNVAGVLDLSSSEIVKIRVENIRLMIGGDSLGEGNLYVTTERIAWLKVGKDNKGKGTGFTVSYPSIAIHAICRDQESFPEPCIFCQLDEPVKKKESGKVINFIEGEVEDVIVTGLGNMVEGAKAGRLDVVDEEKKSIFYTNVKEEAEEGAEEEEETNRIDTLWRGSDELRFIPLQTEGEATPLSTLSSSSSSNVIPGETLSESILDKVFNAMSECAMLHPDGGNDDNGEDEEEEEEDGGEEGMGMMEGMLSGLSGSGGFVMDGALMTEKAMSPEQLAALEAWGAKLKTGQFDDADEEKVEEGKN